MANFAVSHLYTGGEFEVLYKLWLFADVPLFGRPTGDYAVRLSTADKLCRDDLQT